jgi:hypothetical protein
VQCSHCWFETDKTKRRVCHTDKCVSRPCDGPCNGQSERQIILKSAREFVAVNGTQPTTAISCCQCGLGVEKLTASAGARRVEAGIELTTTTLTRRALTVPKRAQAATTRGRFLAVAEITTARTTLPNTAVHRPTDSQNEQRRPKNKRKQRSEPTRCHERDATESGVLFSFGGTSAFVTGAKRVQWFHPFVHKETTTTSR